VSRKRGRVKEKKEKKTTGVFLIFEKREMRSRSRSFFSARLSLDLTLFSFFFLPSPPLSHPAFSLPLLTTIMSATNASLAWAAEQTATFYKLLAHKLKDAGEDAPTGSVFEGGMQLALGGDGEPATSKGGKRALKKAARADKPKRPPSAYNVFIVQESAKLKEAGFKSDKDHSEFRNARRDWT